ncbi:MAG: amidohydrolase family protein [Myxococcota bacterium]
MLLPALVSVPSVAQSVALVGATVYPVSGPVIPDGVVVVQDGKITAVGPRSSVALPDGVEVRDLTGKTVIPGLVDTHSHIGAGGPGDLNESIGPLQPAVSAIDAIDATNPNLDVARAGGITTVNIMPGSRNLVGGQTAYVKLRDATTVDGLLFCADRRTEVCGGLKMANGTNPQGDSPYPRTRMGAAAQVRQLFADAAERRRKLDAAAAPRTGTHRKAALPEPLPPDLGKDALVQVLRGERIVHLHTHRADDIATAVALGEEFGFSPVLHHVSEGWKVADLLAEHHVPCSVIVIDSPGGKEEATEMRLETPGILERAGVVVAIHTDDPITDSRLLLRSAALAVRGGMTEAGALAAVTLNGAKLLRLDDRVGSLDPGKDGDLVVLSGPPLSVWTHVEQTWVEGVEVFDRSDPVDRRYATGGWDQAARYPVNAADADGDR